MWTIWRFQFIRASYRWCFITGTISCMGMRSISQLQMTDYGTCCNLWSILYSFVHSSEKLVLFPRCLSVQAKCHHTMPYQTSTAATPWRVVIKAQFARGASIQRKQLEVAHPTTSDTQILDTAAVNRTRLRPRTIQSSSQHKRL